jgi:Fuc2NAc and GlcNAc transferase
MSGFALLAIALCAAAAGALLTWAALKHALARGILDVPNARSSHVVATPRGGGIAIAVTSLVGALLTSAAGLVPWLVSLTLVCAGTAVAVVGYVDDRRGVSRRVRFLVHLLASAACVILIWSVPHAALIVIAVLALSWAINLFNFMDGIDGLAGSQALFVAGASAILAWSGARDESAVLPGLTAGACCGFLAWNRPPARIFMGDVGSGFLGLWLGAVALVLAVQGSVNIWTSIILGSVFVADATTTLVRRAFSGQRWYQAHRSHAYQKLARRWGSHASVTGLLWLLNLLVVAPIAVLSQLRPPWAPALAAMTLGVFVALALASGAGVEDVPASQ